MIEAAILGTAVKPADIRTSAKGTPWISVLLRSGDGDAAQFVLASIFGDAAVALGHIDQGEKLYVEGRLTISEYTARDGSQRTGIAVACSRAFRPQIGRNRPKRERKAATDASPASRWAAPPPADLNDDMPPW